MGFWCFWVLVHFWSVGSLSNSSHILGLPLGPPLGVPWTPKEVVFGLHAIITPPQKCHFGKNVKNVILTLFGFWGLEGLWSLSPVPLVNDSYLYRYPLDPPRTPTGKDPFLGFPYYYKEIVIFDTPKWVFLDPPEGVF